MNQAIFRERNNIDRIISLSVIDHDVSLFKFVGFVDGCITFNAFIAYIDYMSKFGMVDLYI